MESKMIPTNLTVEQLLAILQDFRKNLKIFPKNKKIKILEYAEVWN